MVLIPSRETRRLFGPSNQPEFNTNVRHRAILRKALELFPAEELEEIFQQPIRLRVAMGSAFTFSQLGKIKTNFVCLTILPTTLVTEMPPGAQWSPCLPRNPSSQSRGANRSPWLS
jgi:hypothetical protein